MQTMSENFNSINTPEELHTHEMNEYAKTLSKPTKKKECKTCKKKEPVTELPPIEIETLVSEEEVKFLYTEMSSKSYSDELYAQLNIIYSMLFQEPLDRCSGCSRRQYRKVGHYVKHVLGKNWR